MNNELIELSFVLQREVKILIPQEKFCRFLEF